jgi:predicted nucleic-acid-binding protein
VKKPSLNLPDTNTIIRYLIKDDLDQYAIADTFFQKVLIGQEKAVILESVLVECIYVLTKIYKVPKKEAADIMIGLLHYKGIQNQNRIELVSALNCFSENHLDIVDCILCIFARQQGCTLFTFDQNLQKIYSK